MFQTVKEHLQGLGFDVKAEVLNTDITAKKDDFLLVVELKTSLNIKLLYQGCMGQKLSDYVYIAIPKPTSKIRYSKSFKEKVHLCKRLGLGLMLVDTSNHTVETHIDSIEMSLRRNKRKRVKLLREFENRVTSHNVGGVTKTKIITSYRERALLIAYYLQEEPRAIKELKSLTNDCKCATILQKNYYHWFDRVERGIYALNQKGIKGLEKYKQVTEEILEKNKRDI